MSTYIQRMILERQELMAKVIGRNINVTSRIVELNKQLALTHEKVRKLKIDYRVV